MRNRWLILPVGLIVLVLVALVLVPLVLQQQTAGLREHRSEVAQPARDLVSILHRALAREMGALRGFVITGEEVFLVRYEEARAEELRAYAELTPLVIELDADVAEAFAELRSRAGRWHGRVTESEIVSRQLVPDDFIARMPSEERLYEETLQAAETLRDRIVAEVERNRREIREMEQRGLLVSALLALLAGAAALVALWLGRNLRLLAVEAERRRLEVQRVSDDRAQLIRGITHDLKNPLGAARGYLELILDGIIAEPARRRESLEHTDRAIGAALAIIEDLIDLSMAEAGELRLTRQPTDLAILLSEIAEDHLGEAIEAGVALDVVIPHDVPSLSTDTRRVREILGNLVSNALKYTPGGGSVTLRSTTRTGENDDRWMAIEVSDTGPGIALEDRERVFQEFTRLEVDEGRAQGTGLGLTISRKVARLLGGEIEVESRVGRGSTFILLLPLDLVGDTGSR